MYTLYLIQSIMYVGFLVYLPDIKLLLLVHCESEQLDEWTVLMQYMSGQEVTHDICQIK
jgi:hypothetical protein